MALMFEILGFGAKALLLVVAFGLCALILLLVIGRLRRRGGSSANKDGNLKVKRLNDEFDYQRDRLRSHVMDKADWKQYQKGQKKRLAEQKFDRRTFVLDFKGDLGASAVESLRHVITTMLGVAEPTDQVVLRVESPGGAAHSYGLAASQLERIRDRGLKLTVCVDQVAASGGYLMACVADQIVAAPFAILGSIGVVMPLPNAHRLLERAGIDYENATSGKHKRTVSPFTKPTPEGRAKLQEQLTETHELFKDIVARHRPELSIEDVATGEVWHGKNALAKGLVNALGTSDEVIGEHLKSSLVLELEWERPRGWSERVGLGIHHLSDRVVRATTRHLLKPDTIPSLFHSV